MSQLLTDEHKTVNFLKGLVLDGVHSANSGHSGGAMSSMDFAYILFRYYLNYDPQNPKWINRDRFVLSAGHESMLLYSLLFARGILTKEDLAAFRRLHSRTPGHPEIQETPGVECTTGPLGQGCAMSVGMAIAAKNMQARFDGELFCNKTWVLMGDGCFQEDVTHGAASLAGHLQLNNLIWFYDKNKKQIAGSIDRVISDNERKIYEGFGFEVYEIDGHSHEQIHLTIKSILKSQTKPVLIVANTIMAKGSAHMEGNHASHGTPFSQNEHDASKKLLGVPEGATFYWPEKAQESFATRNSQMQAHVANWDKQFKIWEQNHPDAASKLKEFLAPPNLKALPKIEWNTDKPIATRQAFGRLLQEWAQKIPQLIGGSADLDPSNMTEEYVELVRDFSRENRSGRNIAYGVREFPMSAISNGLALYGGFLPFDATFLTFSDYSRPALRLGAVQELCVIHEFTHDSFHLGEDGPTHQPVEHLMSLRAMPNMYVMRPCDPFETEVLFKRACELKAPSCVALTRQKVPYLEKLLGRKLDYERVNNGAWEVTQNSKEPELIIFATGAEVSLAVNSAKLVEEEFPSIQGKIAIISVPCFELFFANSKEYQQKMLHPKCILRVSIEAGSTLGWERFIGSTGLAIGIDHFGRSGRMEDLEEEFGFTVKKVSQRILAYIRESNSL